MYQKGRFNGYVTDYGIGETKAGDPQVIVKFMVKFPDGEQEMTWRGSLKGKATEFTLKSLLVLGFEGTDISRLADGVNQPSPMPIAPGAEASLVIDEETNTETQKTYHKISWVNNIGGGGSEIKRMDIGTAKAKLAALNLAGEITKLRVASPTTSAKPAGKPNLGF